MLQKIEKSAIRETLRVRLGSPVFSVELTDDQLDASIKVAEGWLKTICGTLQVWLLSAGYAFDWDLFLLEEYAYATAMINLGMIRGKFGEMPTSSGDVGMNGEQLIALGSEMIYRLDSMTWRGP